jgi:hypothetical protein
MKKHSFGNWLLVVIFMCVAINQTPEVMAAPRKCTVDDEKSVLNMLSPPQKTWGNLHDVYKKYVHCDDGSVGEGFSENVVFLLVNHWPNLNELSQISKKDHKFKNFVIKHIDESVNRTDLESIVSLSRSSCKEHSHALCKKIGNAAISALK